VKYIRCATRKVRKPALTQTSDRQELPAANRSARTGAHQPAALPACSSKNWAAIAYATMLTKDVTTPLRSCSRK
jgi:hypothetical protein